jgi:hypothetical protein
MKMSTTRKDRVWLAGLLMLIVAAVPAAAQTPAATSGRSTGSTRHISFGVLGGPNQARMTLPLDALPPELVGAGITIDNHRRTGFAGGFFVDAPVLSGLGLETGTLVSVKGAGLDISATGLGSASGAIRLVYLDVPFLARVQVAKWSGAGLYLLTGPTVDINLDAKVMVAGTSENLDGFPTMDYAWTAAGRVERDRLLFEVRYDHGLRNLTGVDGTVASSKNRAVYFLAGLRF